MIPTSPLKLPLVMRACCPMWSCAVVVASGKWYVMVPSLTLQRSMKVIISRSGMRAGSVPVACV